MTNPSPPAHRGGDRRCFLLRAAVVVALTATPALAKSEKLDRSLDRLSDKGVFRVAVHSTRTPVPLFRVHQWTLRITDPIGRPVSGALVAVDGGMPEHRHGLPTAPRTTPSESAGEYVISGVKFSMPGWWVLKLDVKAPDGRSDTVTFNLDL